ISLGSAPGEVVGLVGESGCGKTTLARAILGILPAGAARIRGGEIHFKGRDLLREDRDVVNDQVRGRAITFIPQDPFSSFNPVFTVGTQIMDLMKWKSPRLTRGDFHFIKSMICVDRKSTRLNSSHGSISYAVFC